MNAWRGAFVALGTALVAAAACRVDPSTEFRTCEVGRLLTPFDEKIRPPLASDEQCAACMAKTSTCCEMAGSCVDDAGCRLPTQEHFACIRNGLARSAVVSEVEKSCAESEAGAAVVACAKRHCEVPCGLKPCSVQAGNLPQVVRPPCDRCISTHCCGEMNRCAANRECGFTLQCILQRCQHEVRGPAMGGDRDTDNFCRAVESFDEGTREALRCGSNLDAGPYPCTVGCIREFCGGEAIIPLICCANAANCGPICDPPDAAADGPTADGGPD